MPPSPGAAAPPPPPPPSRLRRALAAARSRATLAEASGALGDLGTFLPLTLGLVAGVGLDLGTTLLFTGGYNVALGLAFDIPLPVQPMKTIAALGAAGGVTLAQTLAAGLFVGFVTLALGLTRAVDLLNAIVPPCIVRGLQLGVGLKLAATGVAKAVLVKGAGGKMRFRPAGGADGAALGAAALLFLVAASASRLGEDPADASSSTSPLLPTRALAALRRRRRGADAALDAVPVVVAVEVADKRAGDGSLHGGGGSGPAADAAAAPPLTDADAPAPAPRRPPAALAVVFLGLILAIVVTPPAARAGMRIGPSRITVHVPTAADWAAGVTTAGGAAQVPLTTLNSVVAVTALADSLYGGRKEGGARPPPRYSRPSTVALAVGAMNAVGCWFGAMPACSGSGGLAAQHRFGARTGGAPVMLGTLKIALGLLFGSSLATILTRFPSSLLGGLLACSGAELAAAARREAGPRGFAFAALTAAAILAADDAGVGFAIGYACWLATVAWEWVGGGVEKAAAKWRRRAAA